MKKTNPASSTASLKVIKTVSLDRADALSPTISSQKKGVIDAAVAILQQGGLLIFPTETVYGAGVDATNQEAVDKLLAYKSRREGKPLSIAVTDQKMASQYVTMNEQARRLYKRFLPGPVTVVSKSNGRVADGVASEFDTLGVRIPDFALITQIVEAFGKPITATSANASGQKRPYTLQDIVEGLCENQKNQIDLMINVGKLPLNQPSTVIDTTLSTPITLRTGDADQSQDTITLSSHSELETKKIAGTLLLKHWNEIKENGLVIGLDGALGTGKTIFTKGVATFLHIDDIITSPTYSYIEEYPFHRHGVQGHLYHLDVWKVDSPDLAKRLKIADLIKSHSVVVIEWWSQIQDYVLQLVSEKNASFFDVTITEYGKEQRQLQIHDQPDIQSFSQSEE